MVVGIVTLVLPFVDTDLKNDTVVLVNLNDVCVFFIGRNCLCL